MVIAMISAAITQATAIQRPPKTIHRMFRSNDIGPMGLYLDRTRPAAMAGRSENDPHDNEKIMSF